MKSESLVPSAPGVFGISIIVELEPDARRTDATALNTSIRERIQRGIAESSSSPAKRGEDALVRETKFLQSSLSPFLTTPLRSDAAEVNRILGESLQRSAREGAVTPSRVFANRTGVLIGSSELGEQLRPWADAGLEYLEHAFSHRFNPQSLLLETTVLIDGSMSPAVIEDLLCDVVKATSRVSTYREAAGSVVILADSPLPAIDVETAIESVVTFQVARGSRQLFLPQIIEAMERSKEDGTLAAYSVWALCATYDSGEQLQIRTTWRDEGRMEAGFRVVISVLEQADSRTGEGKPKAVWFKRKIG
jgi:hypothetical protein